MTGTITGRQWHNAMVAAFRDGFAGRLRQCGAYEPDADLSGDTPPAIETPAVLIDLRHMTPADDGARDRQAITCHWTAYCVLSSRTQDLQIELREMAAVAIAIIDQPDPDDPTATRGNQWGLAEAVLPPEEGTIDAAPSEFGPELHGHDCWAVDWQQTGYFSGEMPDSGITNHA